MWVAKVLIDGSNAAGGESCKKFNLNALVYPISTHIKEDGVYLYFSAIVLGGSEEKRNKLIDHFSKHNRILHLDRKEDFVLGLLKESLEVKDLYSFNFIHVKPIYIRKDGYEVWTIGCWEKEDLLKFVDVMDKKFKAKLLQMRKEKLTRVFIMHTHPNITDKQREAIRLAVEKGYYNYPRKIDLESLAKLMGVSYSTYQAHLRKAEREIMPFASKEEF